VAPFACYRCPYGYPDIDGKPDLDRCRMACASYLAYVLEREGDVAAVIAEPARAVPYLPPPGYWKAVRAACDAHGALLIFDEIPTGLGKTGRMFACQHDGVAPDILVMGKALGGGVLPIAATLCRPELDVGGEWAFGHYTHEKNPVTARAALTTIEIIEDEGLVDNAARLGVRALARLEEMKRRHPMIGDVRGRGLLLGVELVRERDSKAPASEAAEEVMYRALERGLSFKTTMGNVLTLTPPLVVTARELDRALDILGACIGEVETGAIGAAPRAISAKGRSPRRPRRARAPRRDDATSRPRRATGRR
jgi:4-aminobutyrate aminotransferase